MKNIIYFVFIASITIINGQCPDNYTVNTQYTSNTINGIIYADEDDYMCFPEEFEFFSSINQMFYFFYDVHINEYTMSNEDWIGAFNGDVCVGAAKWGTCGGVGCSIPVLGEHSNSPETYGYLLPGDIPSFKIYDASENIYIDAISTEYAGYQNNTPVIADLLFSYSNISGCTDFNACNYDPYASSNDGTCEYELLCDASLWDVNDDGVLDNYYDFENNGSITSNVILFDVFHNPNDAFSVLSDIINVISEGDLLTAFVGNEQRGVAKASEVPPFLGGGYAFLMMIYSNETSGEILDFYFYDNSFNEIFKLNETFEFISNMVEGDVQYPIILNLPLWLDFEIIDDELSNDLSIPESFSISNIYPNPFNPSVSIEFKIDEPTNININIYDLKGRFIENINYGYAAIGNHTFLWNSKDLASGTYIVSVFNGEIMSNRKITLIK